MGFCIEVGEAQELVMPQKGKPLTFDSLVEQYEEQARKACRAKEMDEKWWKVWAELWAQTDIEIFWVFKLIDPDLTDDELIEKYCTQNDE